MTERDRAANRLTAQMLQDAVRIAERNAIKPIWIDGKAYYRWRDIEPKIKIQKKK